jgi:hypothetical protein
MGRAKPKPAEAVILPPDLDDDDEEHVGGGIPDDDGWIHLREKRKEKANGEEKPKRRSARRST